MTDINFADQLQDMKGVKFLYKQPELLTIEDHGFLGFCTPDKPFEHVRHIQALPLTMVEFGSAHRDYPVIFSSMESPVPLAVVGVSSGTNLFVDENGRWDPQSYVPSYLRCYPLAFAADAEGHMAVVVDRQANCIGEDSDLPFFIDGEVSPRTNDLIEFCMRYNEERKRTQEFCDKLVELDLLAPLRTTYTEPGSTEVHTLANYVGVNPDKFNDLDADTVFDLHTTGRLSALYLQHYSMENWRHLRARSVAQKAG